MPIDYYRLTMVSPWRTGTCVYEDFDNLPKGRFINVSQAMELLIMQKKTVWCIEEVGTRNKPYWIVQNELDNNDK